MDYFIHLLILIGIYLILAQSFNLCFGLGHLFNLAHIAAYAVGAYVSALLSTEAGWSFPICVVASMIISGIFATLIGAISLKLTQDYFAIGTLAFSSIVTALLINWKSLTRGVLGIPGIPRPDLQAIINNLVINLSSSSLSGQSLLSDGGFVDLTFLGMLIVLILQGFFILQMRVWTYGLMGNTFIDGNNNLHFLYITIFFVIVVQIVLWFLFRSPYARSLRTQAEFEHAALSLGKNTRRIRNISFLISSAFAGLAGALFAYYINYIDPSSFTLVEMIFVLTIVVVGRPGSFFGCLAAAAFLVLLPEPLRFCQISPSIVGPMRQLLHAVILFTVVYINRRRLFPVERKI